jgi:hypothetical protein
MGDFGPKPALAWLAVSKLSVEGKYQRDTGSTRSRHLIAKIVATFRWPRFGAVLVVRSKAGWQVVDGQHRVEAARQLGIARVPAIELPHGTIAAAAADFVAINRDRVAVTPLHIHHAMLAAGEKTAKAIDRACKAAGVAICRYPVPANNLKPGETLAVGTIRRLVEKFGGDVALAVLKRTVKTHGGGPGAVCAATIRESAAALGHGGGMHSAAPVASRQAVKRRLCLSCRTEFISTGAGHRMCDTCRRRV